MPQTPSVTLIIAAYNAADFVTRAIRSALAEPEVAEVVVIDDASGDATSTVARRADDGSGRLKVLRQATNMGPSAARNRAMRESSSPWIGVLDADDFLLPGRTRGLLANAEKGIDFIADDMWKTSAPDVEGARTKLLGDAQAGPRMVDFATFVLSNVTRRGKTRGEMGFIKPLMSRRFLEENALRYREDLRLGEDYEFYARALALGAKLLLIPAQGYVSVVRSDSLSGRHSIEDLRRLRDCNQSLTRSFPLSKEARRALRQHYLSVDCRLQWRLLIDAVKNRSGAAALRTFWRPWPVPFYLIEQLTAQIVLRSVSAIKKTKQ